MARKRNIYSSRNYYNNSSSAYDYDYDMHEFYENEDRKRERERALKLKREAVEVKKLSRSQSIKLLFSVLLVFAGSFAIMLSSAAVDSQRVSNNALKNELSEIKNQNAVLQAKISNEADLNYIEKEAKTRLGMTEPQDYQIVYINVPKQSYTVQYDTEEENDESGFGPSKFIDTLKDILNID